MTIEKILQLYPGTLAADWHQHSNGGGWVYKTAKVADTARVCGTAQVFGDARVCGNEWKHSPLYIQGTRDALTTCARDQLSIGCLVYSVKHWLKHYRAIGKTQSYTPAEIREYGEHIKYAAKWLKALAKRK